MVLHPTPIITASNITTIVLTQRQVWGFLDDTFASQLKHNFSWRMIAHSEIVGGNIGIKLYSENPRFSLSSLRGDVSPHPAHQSIPPPGSRNAALRLKSKIFTRRQTASRSLICCGVPGDRAFSILATVDNLKWVLCFECSEASF